MCALTSFKAFSGLRETNEAIETAKVFDLPEELYAPLLSNGPRGWKEVIERIFSGNWDQVIADLEKRCGEKNDGQGRPGDALPDGRAGAAAVHPQEGEQLRVFSDAHEPRGPSPGARGGGARRGRVLAPADVRRAEVVQPAGGAGGHRGVRFEGAVIRYE